MGKIFSTGKLLLTSEYTVLDGALALAVPTQRGQEFSFEKIPNDKSIVHWKAHHEGKLWLDATIDYKNWKILETNLEDATQFILKVLRNVQQLSATKFQAKDSYELATNLQFPSNYGLGSSSTLMANLAEWAEIDAFVLNDNSLGGSGYDIAVAKERKPLLFQIKNQERIWRTISFEPAFKEDLIFIHLNQKMDSREGIRLYRSKEKELLFIDEFTSITQQILVAKNLSEFSDLMNLHESKLSKFLGLKTAKALYFSDCPSFVKSLGAWGGDFVMCSKFDGYKDYFSEKGFSTILDYKELIL